jgi:AraC-like DNA-binding protein
VRPDEEKVKMSLYVDLAVMFHIFINAVSSGSVLSDIPYCINVGLISISVITMSWLSSKRLVTIFVWITMCLEILSALRIAISSIADAPVVMGFIRHLMFVGPCCMMIMIYVYSIYMSLRDVKYVMKSGSVWTNVTLSVDSVYLAFILMTTMLYSTISATFPVDNALFIAVFTFIYTSMYVALSIRLLNSSAFVIMTEHERKIVESMKISHVDNTQESAGTVMLYKNLYDRVLDYFVECKPYLNPKLTINDVVEVVFSNKLYISKAISQCTGRNFCQFVNYYRITYAVELFRADAILKVLEVATISGFNSVVSLGMAFRLYMGEKPGDWCRREKFRLEKLKK